MLTPRDIRFLAFEEEHWPHTGRKQEQIRAEFGISTARYYGHIARLTDDPEALRHNPQLIYRLMARADAHRNARKRFLGELD